MTDDYNDVTDAAQIAYIIDGIRRIDEAGLLGDFKMTVAEELRALTQRHDDARYGFNGVGRYVAELLHADRERCERIAVGTRASVVITEIKIYLSMISQRAQRDAELERDPRPAIPPGVFCAAAPAPITITASRGQRAAS